MPFDHRLGRYHPSTTLASCDQGCGICERVCPFVPENPATADAAGQLFAASPGIRHHEVLGYYLATRAGYALEYRLTSASGGLATWVLTALLESGQVDHVLGVGADEQSPTLFSPQVCTSAEEVRRCSGSCYQPVDFSTTLRYVLDHDGRYAIMALPCMAKALRLAMGVNPRLRRRISFILGLTCGQVKSRHFVDYLAKGLAGRAAPTAVQFRHKRADRPASDYAFRFLYREPMAERAGQGAAETEIRDVGWSAGIDRVWVERWFALEACDYCDDVFAECADAVFMDAWLPDYSGEWQGTSLVLTRAMTIETLLRQGLATGTVKGADLPPAKVLASQAGVIFQKRVLAGCHYEATGSALRMPRPRYGALTAEQRKVAFVKRGVRSSLQRGASPAALKRAAWCNSAWGWRLAKLYSLLPWRGRKS